ncbi:MAG: aminopeptidase N [Desulfotignum sp.]|nr:aminopeptidase N [Desulfotignum sp.]
MTSHAPKFLKDHTPPEFLIDQADLVFDIQKNSTWVVSSLKLRRNTLFTGKKSPLVLHMGDYEIQSVTADGIPLQTHEYNADGRHFQLTDTKDHVSLDIGVVLYPKKNTRLEGLYKSNHIFCTQCEAEGFRQITPFLDRPDIMTTYSCTIIADKKECPVLLSNGNLVDSGDLEGNRHYVRWEDPFKKPSYLFALVAGDLCNIQDKFITGSGKKVTLKIFAEQNNVEKCRHAMACLKQAMQWDQDRFNLRYDLDTYQIVAIDDFNAGAMENKGLNIFNAKYVLADPKSATDEDFMNIQKVIGHEYFHNWTGNRVTLKNWFQLSLKEGLTVFRDQEFSSDLNSRSVERIANVKKLRMFQFPEDSGPMAHPVRPDSYIKMDNFYTMTVYEKGAELIRMIHQLLGETTFQEGMTLYFKRFDGMAVTIEDFLSVMAQASQSDLTQFKLWYTQSGTPMVAMDRSYDPDTQKLTLTFTQQTLPDRNQDIKLPLHIPVQFALIDAAGNEATLQEHPSLLQLKEATHTFVFEHVKPGTLPSVFRQFSAPVRVKNDLSDDELAFLMAHDTDDFNRWDAAQTLFVKQIQQLVAAIRLKQPLVISPNLVQAFETALSDPASDRAFIARALAIPQETELADHFETIDVAAIHRARGVLKKGLAAALEPMFMETIETCGKSDPDSISFQNIADRSLRNLALSYMSSLGIQKTNDLVFNAFMTARNMTDEFAALKIVSQTDVALKRASAEQFYKKWCHDKLVIDKWFYVEACSPLSDTFETVVCLTAHPDFSLTSPNRVRALIYGFAMNNPVHFHEKTGRGYTFVTDQILELDRINHQIAARLAACFNQWKKHEPVRRSLMKNSLETLMNSPKLSSNLYEIVSRALA